MDGTNVAGGDAADPDRSIPTGGHETRSWRLLYPYSPLACAGVAGYITERLYLAHWAQAPPPSKPPGALRPQGRRRRRRQGQGQVRAECRQRPAAGPPHERQGQA